MDGGIHEVPDEPLVQGASEASVPGSDARSPRRQRET